MMSAFLATNDHLMGAAIEKNKINMQHTATKAAWPRPEEGEPRLKASWGDEGTMIWGLGDLQLFSQPPAERLRDLSLPGR